VARIECGVPAAIRNQVPARAAKGSPPTMQAASPDRTWTIAGPGGRVLREFLAGGEGEQDEPHVRTVVQGLAQDPARGDGCVGEKIGQARGRGLGHQVRLRGRG